MSHATPPTRREQQLYQLLGERINQFRRKAGMSSEDIAALVGVKRPTVMNLESGRAYTSLHMYLRIAWALGIPWSTLMPPHWKQGWRNDSPEGDGEWKDGPQ